jgi:hypothetical protein
MWCIFRLLRLGNRSFLGFFRNLLESDWSVKDIGPAQTSHFQFKAEKLLRDGDFRESRRYIQAQQEPIDVRCLFESYDKSVQRFYAWLMPEIEAHLPPEVSDYRRCIRERRAFAARSWYRILLAQVTPDTDLYSHLPTYLTPAELVEIDALPRRSKQQIDRIIELIDEYGACDAELRVLIYKAFAMV